MDRSVSVKVIVLMVALSGGLSIHSHASRSDAQTYVSRNGYIDSASDGPAGLLLAQRQEDSIRVTEANSTELKSPAVALFYAGMPGFFVHGAGHFYAGKTGTGFVLLGSEVAAATLILVSLGMSWEHGEATGEAFPVAFAGAALFFGSWIYDMIGAPLAVHKDNQRLPQGNPPDLGLRMRAEDLSLVLVYRFK